MQVIFKINEGKQCNNPTFGPDLSKGLYQGVWNALLFRLNQLFHPLKTIDWNQDNNILGLTNNYCFILGSKNAS